MASILGATGDLGDRKRAEEERRKLAMLVEHSTDFIGMASLEGRALYLNPAGCRLVGLEDLQAALATAIPDYLPPEWRRRFAEEVIPATLEAGSWKGEVQFRHFRTGDRIDVLQNVFLIRDPVTGEPLCLATTARDITDRKRSELAIQESEERLRLALEGGQMGMWDWDVQGDRVVWNEREFELLGRTPTSDGWTDADSFFQHVHPDDLPRIRQRMSEVLAQGAHFSEEFRVVGADGEVRWLGSVARVYRDESGEPLHMVGVNFDITARKQGEQALKTADRRKDEFLAMLGHELRNPLVPIRNGVELCRRLSAGFDPTLRQTLEMIDRQSAQLVRLVDDLLDVTRITQGRVALRKQWVALEKVIHQAVETVAADARATRKAMHVTSHEPSLWIEADPARLTQVIANLLSNAVRYTEEGGQIWLEVTRRDAELEIAVSDSGIGIAADFLPHVFEPLARAEPPLDHSHAGLGIGLTLSQRLIELHGGRIEAYSAGPGQGSEFRVYLPLTERDGTRHAKAAPRSIPSVCHRVLVVDDNRDVAASTKMLLNAMGHDADAVYDGRAALEAVRKLQPHVVFVDIGMPGMDGYELARRLRTEHGPDRPYLVAFTGFGQDGAARNALEAGFNRYLAKPATPEALEDVLDCVA